MRFPRQDGEEWVNLAKVVSRSNLTTTFLSLCSCIGPQYKMWAALKKKCKSRYQWDSSALSVKWNDDNAKANCTSNSLLQKHQKIKPFISNAALLHDQKQDCSHFTKTSSPLLSSSLLSSSLFHSIIWNMKSWQCRQKNRTNCEWNQRFNANEQILNVFSSDRKQIKKPTPSSSSRSPIKGALFKISFISAQLLPSLIRRS